VGEAISADAKSLGRSRRELPALSVVWSKGAARARSRRGQGGVYDLSKRGAGSHLRCGVESARECGCNRKKGGYLNHARLRETLLQDLLARVTQTEESATEHREYWWVEADEEMRMYLERELGWLQVRWSSANGSDCVLE